MRIARMIVIAFATTRVIDTVKEISPLIPPPWAKSVAAIVVGAGLSALSPQDHDIRTVALTGIGAAGLAGALHDLQDMCTSIGDNNRTEVLARLPRRAQPLTPSRPAGPLGA